MSTISPAGTLGRGPILWVVVGLTLSILPILPTMPIWVPIAFLAAGIWRIWIEFHAKQLPGGPIRLVFFVLSLGGVLASVGGPMTSESGVSYLVMLTALKFLELRTPRDYVLISSLGYFLLLSGFLFTDSLASSAYSVLVVVVLTAGIVRLTIGEPRPGIRWEEMRETLWIVGQAAPVALVLFLFFPRIQGLQVQLFNRDTGKTGMSEELSPGSFAKLASTREEAFRVEFDEGQMIDVGSMYWRGTVLWEGYEDGFSWRRGARIGRKGVLTPRAGSKRIGQTVILSPHRQRWMFTLDHAISVEGGDLEAGAVVESRKNVTKRIRYRATSELGVRLEKVPADLLTKATELPRAYRAESLDPKLQKVVDLAAQLAKGTNSREEIVQNALGYFQNGGFSYSLKPGDYKEGGMSEFLFERKKGFCEHYATAFATLMRLAGVPAVVVLGYQGGDVNRVGHFVTIRQSDAHAWTEVYLGEDRGWLRVDPTGMVAPERVTYGMDPYAEFAESGTRPESFNDLDDPSSKTGLLGVLREMRYSWDALSYEWDLAVLNYDSETQAGVYKFLGIEPNSAWIWILPPLLLVLLLGVLTWILKQPRRILSKGSLTALFQKFCGMLAGRGVIRLDCEGPLDFANRAADRIPGSARLIRQVAGLYAEARFGKEQEPSSVRDAHLKTMKDLMKELRKELAKSGTQS